MYNVSQYRVSKALDTLVAYSLAFPWLFIVRKHLHVQVHCALCTVRRPVIKHHANVLQSNKKLEVRIKR